MIRIRFTELLTVEQPVAQAAWCGWARAEFVAAVAEAGAFAPPLGFSEQGSLFSSVQVMEHQEG
jgi:NAD(P)H-dependent flavin oxidoreductase YrpB (nitropropane dioxygenase family)